MKLTIRQRQQLCIVFLAVIILTAFSLVNSLMESREQMRQGILRGSAEDDVYQETFVVETEDGVSQDIDVIVYPRELSQEECQELLDTAVEEFQQQYLGENDSADYVCYDLAFPKSLCQERVLAEYDSDAPELIWEDGSVTTENIPAEGQLVTVKATFACQDSVLEHVFCVQVKPMALTEEQRKEEEIRKAIAQAEADSRTEERFFLPEKINGQVVTWKKKMDLQPMLFVLLGAVAAVCIVQKSRQDEQQERLRREKTFLQEYPQMVTQLSLLMGAGMTLTTAWERLVKRYLEEQTTDAREQQKHPPKRLYMEEMLITYREMKEGKSIRRAYENFGDRIGLTAYRKLSALLIQNLDKGTRDIVHVLDTEAMSAIEEQKRAVRKQGEEAGTKLLFPMLLLFLMILIVIMVPAMQSF